MFTTDEAAKRLGVSKRRVTELARTGELTAQKVSGVWLIDEDAVNNRERAVDKKGGRPVRGEGRGEVRLMLMNRTHEIAKLSYDTEEHRFNSVIELFEMDRAPIGLSKGSSPLNLALLNEWWRSRGIPHTRANISSLLHEAGVSLPEELLERNLGLSLSDQYWVCPESSGLEWESVNFFNNDFEQVAGAIEGVMPGESSALAHPDNTSDGNLTKTWEVRGGERTLVKGGSGLCQEPFNEAVATALHKRLLTENEYVPYTVEATRGGFVSACANFLADDEEYIPAVYVERLLDESNFPDSYRHYVSCAENLGVGGIEEALAHMIVCDDIIANSDRHHRNFGLVRNVETLECRPAPLFDSGSSLWCNIPLEALAAGEHSFESKQFYSSPARQLLLADDMSWVTAAKLDGFVDEAMTILSANLDLAPRLPYIREALEWRVRRILDIAEWG